MVVLSLKMHLCSGSYVPLWEIYPCTNIKQEIQYACTKMLENWCSQWWKIRNLFMFYGGELTEWLWFLYLAVCSGHKYTTTLSLHKAVYCWIWWRSTLCQARSQMPEILMSKGKCLSLRSLSSGKTDRHSRGPLGLVLPEDAEGALLLDVNSEPGSLSTCLHSRLSSRRVSSDFTRWTPWRPSVLFPRRHLSGPPLGTPVGFSCWDRAAAWRLRTASSLLCFVSLCWSVVPSFGDEGHCALGSRAWRLVTSVPGRPASLPVPGPLASVGRRVWESPWADGPEATWLLRAQEAGPWREQGRQPVASGEGSSPRDISRSPALVSAHALQVGTDSATDTSRLLFLVHLCVRVQACAPIFFVPKEILHGGGSIQKLLCSGIYTPGNQDVWRGASESKVLEYCTSSRDDSHRASVFIAGVLSFSGPVFPIPVSSFVCKIVLKEPKRTGL